ncbi:GNAT family N-acetyltransferase [Paenibacillus sp. N3/727]|uniref:GNAT family N-acetyltransferase n=1 Tax=Paenibacillus sp. N3/727 TaxID=2925845 RepID=UPI001F539354|nr:GNAT family N-acetyltransferase [Paenibacillus sp. N3/727]UNK20686.1 GNAT family N-acetyltransferase [Paenibacillus sp. N3/727]
MKLAYEIVKRSILSPLEMEQVKSLEEVCNSHDQIVLKLNWNMLRSREGTEITDLLAYVDGRLVGFLGLYMIEAKEIELSGMVHPEYRRQGIFREMFRQAKEEAVRKQLDTILIINPGSSESGKAFSEALFARYKISEYYMERQHEYEDKQPSTIQLKLRLATIDDLAELIRFDQEGFSSSPEDAEQYEKKALATEKVTILMAEIKEKPVGKILLRENETEIFFYGFVVSKELRGKGYGRKILNDSITYAKTILQKEKQALEVAATNAGALYLYQSCGFVSIRQDDYYELRIDISERVDLEKLQSGN